MIVKIFRPRSSFKAIDYNLGKVLSGGGELMKIKGFEALKMLPELRIGDYVNYLKAQSGLNGNIRKPQFHAMISAPDADFDKRKLTGLAEDWLKSMGYGEQPCLLVFHKDTDQAHLHMVTTRVDRHGRKIDSAFEYKRAVQELNRLMGLDMRHQAQLDAGKALSYACSTKAQVLLLLEGMGYHCREKDGAVILNKFGSPLFNIRKERLESALAAYRPDEKRTAQLKAIFAKYRKQLDTRLYRAEGSLAGGRSRETLVFRSELSDFLQEKFGLELIFHASGDKPPYGYTVIDHAQHRVFKGSELMRLAELIGKDSQVAKAAQSSFDLIPPDSVAKTATATPVFRPYFTNDVDDQQIHGPRRRRQKKARTNTR